MTEHERPGGLFCGRSTDATALQYWLHVLFPSLSAFHFFFARTPTLPASTTSTVHLTAITHNEYYPGRQQPNPHHRKQTPSLLHDQERKEPSHQPPATSLLSTCSCCLWLIADSSCWLCVLVLVGSKSVCLAVQVSFLLLHHHHHGGTGVEQQQQYRPHRHLGGGLSRRYVLVVAAN